MSRPRYSGNVAARTRLMRGFAREAVVGVIGFSFGRAGSAGHPLHVGAQVAGGDRLAGADRVLVGGVEVAVGEAGLAADPSDERLGVGGGGAGGRVHAVTMIPHG